MATIRTSSLVVSRVTTNINISSEINTIPTITMQRATVWLDPSASSNPVEQVIQIKPDPYTLKMQGTIPEFNNSLTAICTSLGLDPNTHSLFALISVLTDYLDPQHNPQASAEVVDPNAPFEEPQTQI